MGSGYDYDYMLPRGALSRFFVAMSHVWPDWIAELEGGTILRCGELQGELPPAAESGLVLHRDMRMRDRFHAEGGFEDVDGSSSINLWILGWDEVWVRVDFVTDLLPPSAFLERALGSVAQSIADVAMCVEHSETSTRYVTAMEPGWASRNWSEIVKLEARLEEQLAHVVSQMQFLGVSREESMSASAIEVDSGRIDASLIAAIGRSVVRLLGYWHRILYAESSGSSKSSSLPPGDLRSEPMEASKSWREVDHWTGHLDTCRLCSSRRNPQPLPPKDGSS